MNRVTSFEDFCYKVEDKNGSVTAGSGNKIIKKNFKMGQTGACSYAIGNAREEKKNIRYI